MKKRKLSERILDVITDTDIIFIAVIILISVHCLVTAFYSHSKVNETELEKAYGVMESVETGSRGKSNYVIFFFSYTERFYVQTDGLPGGKTGVTAALEKLEAQGKQVTVLYTTRRNLTPGFYNYSSYHRVVAIQTEEETIISVDDYNKKSIDYFIGGIVGFVLFMFFAIWLIKMKY